MGKRNVVLVAVALLCVLLAGPVWSDPLLYDNGAPDTATQGFTTSYVYTPLHYWADYRVSNSFTVSTDATLTTATVGLWGYPRILPVPDIIPQKLDWAIGTTPYGSDISSGTGASLNNVYEGSFTSNWPLWESSFSVTGTVAAGTTYYLTLSKAYELQAEQPAAWGTWWSVAGQDDNAPSVAYSTEAKTGADPLGNLASVTYPASKSNSESFQIYGTESTPPPTSVPEPISLVLLGLGLIGVAGARRKLHG
jgi:hypothetical protein